MDEGYIKYTSFWTKETIPIDTKMVGLVNNFRNKLVKLNMIGKIPDGPGFGNVSVKFNNNFYISGTNTGHFESLKAKDFAFVSKVDIENNMVWCKGETEASSESMSHAVIYENCPEINAVIHIHHKELWNNLKNRIPTTNENISYGTVEMAKEIQELLSKTNLVNDMIVLGGHEDGIISFGETIEKAYLKITESY